MKKTHQLILLSLLMMIPSNGRAVDSTSCEAQARQFGNGKGPSYLGPECIQQAMQNSCDECRSIDSPQQMVIGYENFILIRRPDRPSAAFIAGSFTQLKNIESISVDYDEGLISVVNEGESTILQFPLDSSGNIAPTPLKARSE